MSNAASTPLTQDIVVRNNKFEATVDGARIIKGYSFYRGEHTNFGPELAQIDQPDGVIKFVLNGLMPPEPFISETDRIVAFGSCFASNISNYLSKIGFNVLTATDNLAYVSRFGDGMVNTFALRQQFEWAWHNVVPKSELWHGYRAEEFGYDEEVRLKTQEIFNSCDVFILTLGLSEIWYDEPTGEVFWRAVPADKFDATRHKFRIAEYEESLSNISAIYHMIRKHRPSATVVFTLSPIPLAATFRPVSCITANSSSKAILRAAVDRFYRDMSPNDERLFYFPSYEIVTECFRHQFGSDRRHVHPHVLRLNMMAFERYFCKTGGTDEDLIANYVEALALDRELGGEDKTKAIERITRDRTAEQESAYAARLQSREVRLDQRRAAYAAAKEERVARRALEGKAPRRS